ncbi:MAG: FISUMP domain-containing protein [Bacteroidota bacterium]
MKTFVLLLCMLSAMSAFSQFNCGNNFTDPRDGKIYPTVQIGSQCWFAKNLNYGTFTQSTTSGSPHSNVSNNGVVQKYCYNNVEDSCISLGGMYEWDELMNYTTTEKTQGICPDGWHIPSDQELKEMEMAIGMSQTEADNLGQRGTDEGTKLRTGGSSGFEALLNGYRYVYGQSAGYSTEYYLWTSTVDSADATKAYYRSLRSSHTQVERARALQIHGFSIRCLLGQGMSVSELEPDGFFMSDPVPNPASGEFCIKFNLPPGVKTGTIVIYDALGREVISKKTDNSCSSVIFDAADIQSGTYYFYFQYGDVKSSSKKLVIQKTD